MKLDTIKLSHGANPSPQIWRTRVRTASALVHPSVSLPGLGPLILLKHWYTHTTVLPRNSGSPFRKHAKGRIESA